MWSLLGLVVLALLKGELKGRSLLAHIVVFASGPIVMVLYVFYAPFTAFLDIYRDNQKPPKQIHIDPAIREAARWLEAEKSLEEQNNKP